MMAKIEATSALSIAAAMHWPFTGRFGVSTDFIKQFSRLVEPEDYQG